MDINFNHTKIIATIGPSSNTLEKITALIEAGADVFRLNTSHGSPEDHENTINLIQKASQATSSYSAILLDLQGPKLRVGKLIEDITIVDNSILTFEKAETQSNQDIIPIDADIFDDLRPGLRILINDGRLELITTEVNKASFKAKVVNGGVLSSRKGINIPEVALSIPAITDKDKEYITFGVKHKVDFFALSFVRDGNDLKEARAIINKLGSKIPLIAKIEKPQAVQAIDYILNECEGLMVARGDLGVELSVENVPLTQKMLIYKANMANKPVIVATQMLESMVDDPIPTRAEVNDVANAILDGTDAVMLSDETTIGKFPIKAVQMMNKIATTVEQNPLYDNVFSLVNTDSFTCHKRKHDIEISRYLNDIDLQAIVALTVTGITPTILSKAKLKAPIIALSKNEAVCRFLSLIWGVIPLHFEGDLGIKTSTINKIRELLIAKTFLKKNDKIMIVSGLPYFAVGKTSSFHSVVL